MHLYVVGIIGLRKSVFLTNRGHPFDMHMLFNMVYWVLCIYVPQRYETYGPVSRGLALNPLNICISLRRQAHGTKASARAFSRADCERFFVTGNREVFCAKRLHAQSSAHSLPNKIPNASQNFVRKFVRNSGRNDCAIRIPPCRPNTISFCQNEN